MLQRKVVAYIVNPKNAKRIIPKLSKRVPLEVPSTNEIKFNENVIYVFDAEGINILKMKDRGPNVIVIDELFSKGLSINAVVEYITCLSFGKERYNEVVIGIDVNSGSLAYAILADGILLEYDNITLTGQQLHELIHRLIRDIPCKRLILKIGLNALRENVLHVIISILKSLDDEIMNKIQLHLVEETYTSISNPYIGLLTRIRNRDVKAAVNIALREGLKII